jgi:rhomboid family GlyGly-CTERM serine protease
MNAVVHESRGGEAGGFAAAALLRQWIDVRRLPLITLLLTALAFATLGAAASEAFQYDRERLAAGELRRVLTCQWTHWSLDHLLWDAAVFAALGAVCERRDRRGFLATVLVAAVGVPVAVYLSRPELLAFRGLSGIDSALVGLVLADLTAGYVRRKDRRGVATTVFISFLFLAKTGDELVTGNALFVDATAAGFVAVPEAHLVGFAIGIAVTLTSILRPRSHGSAATRHLASSV